MIIRPATVEEIPVVRALIDNLQVSREREGWQDAKTGIFEYPKTEKELVEALNPHFVVATVGGKIRGYSLAYDHEFFRAICAKSPSLEFQYMLERVDGKFLYADQMGVELPFTLGGGRTASALADAGIQGARETGLEQVVAYVCHEPLFNQRSDNFLSRKGFNVFGKVEIENGIVLGAYRLSLK